MAKRLSKRQWKKITIMKKCYSLYFILCSILSFSQESKLREYSYKAPHYYESINLLKDGTFKYYKKTEFLKEEIFGNWQLRNDTILVLDSNPQRSRLVVDESLKRKKKIVFYVRDSQGNPFNYYLYTVYNQNDTIIYKDQFEKTIVKNRPSAFYIISSEGLRSPVYDLKGKKSNFFDIRFERQRTFENEQWKFNGNKIIPLGLDGKYSNYQLK